MRKIFGGAILTVALLLSGCGSAVKDGGGAQNYSSGSSSSSTSSGTRDLSSIGKTPDFSWHDSYLTGKHSSLGCGTTCHSMPVTGKADASSAGLQITSDRKQICYQCHAGNYNATTALNHAAYNIGTYCNSCHYSDSFKTHNRASHNQYHSNITANCASCHSSRYPSSHASTGRTSGCENCHSYQNGSWANTGGHSYTSGCVSCHAGKKPASHANRPNSCESCHTYPNWSAARMDHTGISSGCASCHSKHYSGFSCEGCHTQGISWSFSHGRVSSSNCAACHDGNGEHGGDGGDHEGGDHGGDHEGGGDHH